MRTTSIASLMFLSLLNACAKADAPAAPPSSPLPPAVETTPGDARGAFMPILPPRAYAVGGTVAGLVGSGLVLRIDERETINVDQNGSFAFPTAIQEGQAYLVVIDEQPSAPDQTCSIIRGRGVVLEAAVTTIEVVCEAPVTAVKTYAVGGAVSGLSGTLRLVDGASAPLAIQADGPFVFPTLRPAGDSYDVRIDRQPDGQHCWVERGVGIVQRHTTDTVAVTCVDASCVNLGWKTGGASWACPLGFRLPTADEIDRVSPCLDPSDIGRFSAYADIAVSVGGCGCSWNADYCDEPSIETMRNGLACGDYAQLQVCVMD